MFWSTAFRCRSRGRGSRSEHATPRFTEGWTIFVHPPLASWTSSLPKLGRFSAPKRLQPPNLRGRAEPTSGHGTPEVAWSNWWQKRTFSCTSPWRGPPMARVKAREFSRRVEARRSRTRVTPGGPGGTWIPWLVAMCSLGVMFKTWAERYKPKEGS